MTQPLVQSTGRRKRAVARVRIREGSGNITINSGVTSGTGSGSMIGSP